MNGPPGIARPPQTTPSECRVSNNLDNFVMGLLTEILNSASADFWERRAAQYEWARPSLGDFHGQRDKTQLGEKWRELTEIAEACRNKAAVLRNVAPGAIDPDVRNVWQELAA